MKTEVAMTCASAIAFNADINVFGLWLYMGDKNSRQEYLLPHKTRGQVSTNIYKNKRGLLFSKQTKSKHFRVWISNDDLKQNKTHFISKRSVRQQINQIWTRGHKRWETVCDVLMYFFLQKKATKSVPNGISFLVILTKIMDEFCYVDRVIIFISAKTSVYISTLQNTKTVIKKTFSDDCSALTTCHKETWKDPTLEIFLKISRTPGRRSLWIIKQTKKESRKDFKYNHNIILRKPTRA